MRRQLLITAAIILASASWSMAQQPPPGVPLGTSGNGFGQSPPSNAFNYLNINRAGASAGINYYSLVKPFNSIQNSFSSLQNQVNQVQGSVYDAQTGAVTLVTNRPSFLNTSGYFMTYGPGGASGGGRPLGSFGTGMTGGGQSFAGTPIGQTSGQSARAPAASAPAK